MQLARSGFVWKAKSAKRARKMRPHIHKERAHLQKQRAHFGHTKCTLTMHISGAFCTKLGSEIKKNIVGIVTWSSISGLAMAANSNTFHREALEAIDRRRRELAVNPGGMMNRCVYFRFHPCYIVIIFVMHHHQMSLKSPATILQERP